MILSNARLRDIAIHKGKKVLPRPSPMRVTGDPAIFLGMAKK
jgi:hypothetical protein